MRARNLFFAAYEVLNAHEYDVAIAMFEELLSEYEDHDVAGVSDIVSGAHIQIARAKLAGGWRNEK